MWQYVLLFLDSSSYDLILQAIASLKKALYLAPFEWIISFNLGLVHLHTEQYPLVWHLKL